jgi:hypothetical protein
MKAYEIPVSKPVYKMLKRDYGYNAHMRIDRMLLCKVQGRHEYWEKYISNTPEGHIRITLICPYASAKKLYTVARLMEYEFRTKMLLYIESFTDNGGEASEAIRRFMDKYDISFEELEIETAYKQWQRYKKKEKQRNLIPLW